MKKIQLFVISLTVLLFASCGSSKKVAETSATGETRTEIKIPCEEYTENTKDEFRATASASSPNHQFAKDKAMGLARNALAQKIQVAVIGMFDTYADQNDIDNIQEFRETTKNISSQVADQTLSGINAICQKDFTLSSGKYEVWIALEMPVENVGKELQKSVSNEKKIRLDYDYEKFKEELQKEIEKKKNQ
jgi:hypothetical protein